MGYEVRYDSDPRSNVISQHETSSIPDASFLYSSESYLFDHLTSSWYLILTTRHEPGSQLFRLDKMREVINKATLHEGDASCQNEKINNAGYEFKTANSREDYLSNIATAKEFIRGNTVDLFLLLFYFSENVLYLQLVKATRFVLQTNSI